MTTRQIFDIAVFEGDGIGPEIMGPCCALLQQACARVSAATDSQILELKLTSLPAGAAAYQSLGQALPDSSVDAARQADAVVREEEDDRRLCAS